MPGLFDAYFDPDNYRGSGGGLLSYLPLMQAQMAQGPGSQQPQAQPPISPSQQPQAPQQQMQPQAQPSFMSGVDRFLGNNSNMLLGMGAALASGQGWGGGLQGAMMGRQLDTKTQNDATAKMAVYQALTSRGVPHAEAIAAANNPMVAKQLIETAIAKPEFKEFSGIYGSVNPQTGRFTQQGSVPQLKSVNQGDVLYSLTPEGGGTGWAAQKVAEGGEKPLVGEAMGKMALLQTARPGLDEARKYFLSPDFSPRNAIDAISKTGGQALGAGEIGRQRRNIQQAIESALRIATGAAATEGETKRYMDLYMPSVYDSEATRRDKLDRLDAFIANATASYSGKRVQQPAASVTRFERGPDGALRRVP